MALSNIYIYNYNNYFNRRVKKEASLAGYGTPIYSLTNTNFNPSDGVVTAHVLGTNDYNGKGDYLIETDSANNILSRWFIVEADRTKTGQYQVVLKRDVIVDNYSTVTTAPCFIKKAMVDYNNPLILNSEGMTYNQIKKQEILLKDKSNTPWIVGYISKKDVTSTRDYADVTVNQNGAFWQGSVAVPYNQVTDVTIVDEDEYGNRWEEILSPGLDSLGIGFTFSNGVVIFGFNAEPFAAQVDPSLTTTTVKRVEISGGYGQGIGFYYDYDNPEYIDAEDLPWDFDPTDTGLGGIASNATISLTGINYIHNHTVVRSYPTLSKSGTDYKTSYTTDITTQSDAYDSNQQDNMYPLYGNFYMGGNEYYFKYAINQILSTTGKITQSDVNEIMDKLGVKGYTSNPELYNNKLVKYNNVLYRLTVGSATTTTKSFEFNANTTQDYSLYTKWQNTLIAIKDYWNSHNSTIGEMFYHIADGTVPGTSIPVWGNRFGGSTDVTVYPLTITRYVPQKKAAGFWIPSAAVRQTTADAPYDVFAIPYDRVHLQLANRDTDPRITDELINALSVELGSQLYDLQLLPYCPLLDVQVSDGVIREVGSSGIDYNYIRNSDSQIVGIIYFCSKAKGTFDIPVNLEIANYTQKANINKKIDSETVNYRLVSPNYNGQFEFKTSFNNANISKINIDFEYKPYSPYIHACPVFDSTGLYGGDYDDARGLICGGDFSLPIINDAWTEYQIQNKNYQNIFDRQIQNMQVNFNLQQKMKDDQAIIGIFTSTAAGTGAGAAIGGGWGALAGAVLGAGAGVAGAIGRTLDTKYETKQFTEQVSAMKDTFRYQLQNVQALPYSLSKVSSLNNNNKIFPFIEKYTATDKEVEALIKKITYTSMEIGIVDTINNYIDPSNLNFLSGDLLILDGLNDDTHVANEIYNEIKKGVYI